MRRVDRRRRLTRPHDDGEAGMATAEFAVALPAVVLVLTLIVALAQALVLQHRMTHAASVGARVAARGESVSAVEAAARSQDL